MRLERWGIHLCTSEYEGLDDEDVQWWRWSRLCSRQAIQLSDDGIERRWNLEKVLRKEERSVLMECKNWPDGISELTPSEIIQHRNGRHDNYWYTEDKIYIVWWRLVQCEVDNYATSLVSELAERCGVGWWFWVWHVSRWFYPGVAWKCNLPVRMRWFQLLDEHWFADRRVAGSKSYIDKTVRLSRS